MSTLSQFFGGSGGTTLPIPLSPDSFTIDVLIVGGGGASGAAGGGRVIQVFGLLIEKNTVYSAIVGGAGQDSKFGEILAQAGGSSGTSSFADGEIGGSGGGGVYLPTDTGSGGATIFPTVGSYTINGGASACNIISSGNNGSSAATLANGAGGGAGSAATNATTLTSGIGGSALRSIIKGPGPYLYGAGIPFGVGAGGENTGTGGQSGVVIIAYPDTLPLATTTGSPILYTDFPPSPFAPNATRPGYHVYEFIGSGTITFN